MKLIARQIEDCPKTHEETAESLWAIANNVRPIWPHLRQDGAVFQDTAETASRALHMRFFLDMSLIPFSLVEEGPLKNSQPLPGHRIEPHIWSGCDCRDCSMKHLVLGVSSHSP